LSRTLCAYSIHSPEFYFIDPSGNKVTARLPSNLVTTSIVVMRTAVAGLGLWLCPTYIVFDLLACWALVPLLTDYSRPEMKIVALYPHPRRLSAKVRLILDRLVDRFAEEQRRLDTARAQ
jgi:DNA-binding transcriptional LysR family regulator